MSKFIQSQLRKGEQVQYSARVSHWVYFWYYFFGFGLWFFGGPLLWVLAFLKCRANVLVITDERVIAKFGLVRRHVIELPLQRIESIQVHQSVLGRLLGYGTIVISGSGNPMVPFPSIIRPMQFRTSLDNVLHGRRS